MVDYSKWDHIELSDDDEDCHPNIDKNSWIKWKKESKEIKKKEDEERRKLEEERLKNIKDTLKKKEEELAKAEAEKAKEIQKELEKLKGEEVRLDTKIAKEEELKKKHPVWDEKTICKEGFSKSIVNKNQDPLAKKPDEFRKELVNEIESKALEEAKSAIKPEEPPKHPSELLTEEQKKKYQEEEEQRLNEFVRQMEIKAHKLANCKNYDEYLKAISEAPEVICEETHQYLLLHTSDLIKNGHDEASKRYLKASCIANYCTMLGPNGVELFFARMRDPNPKYRQEFEKETLDYWHRIKDKLQEMGKIKPKE